MLPGRHEYAALDDHHAALSALGTAVARARAASGLGEVRPTSRIAAGRLRRAKRHRRNPVALAR